MEELPPAIRDAHSLAVISPHLDDAVLSCGALLGTYVRLGRQATTVTLFNGKPQNPLSEAAVSFHESIGLRDDPMGSRETEDDHAHALLGVETVRLDMAEALYRCDDAGQHLYPGGQDIFVSQEDIRETEMVDRIAEALSAVPALRSADLVLAPLGVGNHVDHLLVSAAARLLDRPAESVIRYEELPYILYDHCAGWEETLAHGSPFLCRFSEEDWERKLDAIDCYASQHPILWFEPEFRRQEITGHARKLGSGTPAERYWRSQ